jgi:hypothetical protein
MAIGDFFTGIGQGIGRGLTKIGGYDPMQQVSPEEAARRRQEGLAALQRSLGRSSAILSGDPRRMQLAEQQTQRAEQERKEQELNKKLDDAIDKSNLPQSQKDLLKSLNVQIKAQTLMQTFEPEKTLSTAQRVSEIAAKVANDPNYKLTKQDELILQISRKADPLTRGIEDISAEALSEYTKGKGTLQTYASTQDALNAGLKSGDQFIGTDGVTYRIP